MKAKVWIGNIEERTLQNKAFRRVISTGRRIQLVVMKLNPMESIGLEVHQDTDQFIRIESGRVRVRLGKKYPERMMLEDNDAILIPAGTWHNLTNTSRSKSAFLYTLYAPPEHAPGLIRQTKKN